MVLTNSEKDFGPLHRLRFRDTRRHEFIRPRQDDFEAKDVHKEGSAKGLFRVHGKTKTHPKNIEKPSSRPKDTVSRRSEKVVHVPSQRRPPQRDDTRGYPRKILANHRRADGQLIFSTLNCPDHRIESHCQQRRDPSPRRSEPVHLHGRLVAGARRSSDRARHLRVSRGRSALHAPSGGGNRREPCRR